MSILFERNIDLSERSSKKKIKSLSVISNPRGHFSFGQSVYILGIFLKINRNKLIMMLREYLDGLGKKLMLTTKS